MGKGKENRRIQEEKGLLSLRLLGPPEASFRGRPPLRFRVKKALALLCYLAAEGGSRHQRRDLAELLWPQSQERHARTDLRAVLARLRKTLGEGSAQGGEGEARLLLAERDLLGIESRAIELDLDALEAAVSLARRETSPGGSSAANTDAAAEGRRELIGRLRGALGLYRGEFMEGFSLEDSPEFEVWLEAQRTRWRALFGELCERASRLEAQEGLIGEAIGTARLWARHTPLEEAAYRRLMELLSSAGESEGALVAYEGFRDALARELGMEPPPRIQELARGLREEVDQRASLGAGLVRPPATTTTPDAGAGAGALSGLEVPLVGRQEEFGALVSEYHAAREGQTRVVALVGEAGMGKTRLAEEFLGWAKSRGADVLKGEASEGTGGLPYGPLIEAMRPRIERERAPDDLLEDVWLSELSRLLPELKERYPDLPAPTSSSGERETAKGALFEAVARVVEALASGAAPVVLFLDDLQWADAATLEVLEYAGRRWAEQGAPVLVLIGARPEEPQVGSAFRRWLSALGRRLPARSLTLGPLGNEDVEGLLGRLARVGSSKPPAADPEEPEEQPGSLESGLKRLGERLAAETGGQPFYVVETLKALLEEGKLLIRSRADGESILEVGSSLRVESDLSTLLPHPVREVISARLSRFSAAASELLRAAAVLERSFDFRSVVRMTGLEEAQGLTGLEELVEHRILLEQGGGGAEAGSLLSRDFTYSFSHEKIRQVAYTEGGRARRRLLHRRAFGVLQGSGAPPAELARHALVGGLAKEAFAYSVAAGDGAAEVFAVEDAIGHYERARNLLAAEEQQQGGALEPSISDIEHLYSQLGRTYEMADRWDKARETYEATLALAREMGEVGLEVITLNHLAVLTFHHEVDEPKVRMLLEEARRVAEEAGLAEALADTECKLVGLMAVWAGEIEYSMSLAEKALASARALERPDLVAQVLTALAQLGTFAGRLEEARAHAEEGAALARELAERPPPPRTEFRSLLVMVVGLSASWRAGAKAMEIFCRMYVANILIYQGRLQEGMAAAREVRSIAEDMPDRIEMVSLWAIGNGLLHLGDYEEVLAIARTQVEQARAVRDKYLLGANLGRLGETYEALMNLKEARAAYEEAMDVGHYGVFSHARYCVLAAVSEDWEDAHAHAKRAHEVGTFFIPMFSIHLHREVEALLRGGDEDLLAREEVHRFSERAKTNRRDRMSYLRALAVLDEWEGDTDRATEYLREAEALAEGIGLPGELWQIRARIGELHERRGEAEQAREAFSRAAHTLRDLAAKIEDQGLREGFIAAPKVRRVLARENM